MTIKIKHLTIFLTLVLAVLLLPSVVRSQTRTFTHRNRDYALDLPSSEWSAIRVSGIAHDSTEFRYGDQGLVKMRIRRELVDADVLPSDLVKRQQSLDRNHLRGYVEGKTENIEGELHGAKYKYSYISAGEPKARLIYYLEADNRTIYRIEFAGSPKDLLQLGNQTDLIAQSFRLK